MTREDPIVIVSAVRTPMGGFLGDFKDVNAATLGAAAVRAAVERARLQADEVDEAVLDAEQDVRLGHEGADARP